MTLVILPTRKKITMTRQTLLLNSDYSPLKVVSWQRAVCLWFSDKVEVVEEYDDFDLKSMTLEIKCPAVVRLISYVKGNRSRVKFSRINVFGRDRFTCQYCIAENHRVLTSDLQWIPAKELREGDSLVGFDEYAEGRRKYKTSVVESHQFDEQNVYRVTFDDNSILDVTKEHRLLCRESSKHAYDWVETPDLVGMQVPKLFDTWGFDRTRDGGWLAGMFDGEGWLRNRQGLTVGIAQNPGLVFDKLKMLLESDGFDLGEALVKSENDCVRLVPRGGGSEAARLLGFYRPERLLSKFEPSMLGALNASSWKTVVSVALKGKERIVKMKTSTATFIAEGLPNHNCGDQPGTSQLTYDHVLPRSRGGKTCWDNIVTCCISCNSRKDNKTPEEAGFTLARKPVKPNTRPYSKLIVNLPKTPEAWRSYLYWQQELEHDE